ncbi:hypothetical protein [Nonomuraea typhae]|uniref:hypothetical protein n=1 Tax=Nonomuraea typhae TaxID=2603600 RepID=UPI0012F932EF|nr:hypothetical protein [Nonomuraea typhae]
MTTSAPYTYVTVSMHPDAPSRVSVSFHTPHIRARSWAGDSGKPFLDLSSDEATVTISTTGAGPVTDQDLELATDLFNAAARYLALCEHLHAKDEAA